MLRHHPKTIISREALSKAGSGQSLAKLSNLSETVGPLKDRQPSSSNKNLFGKEKKMLEEK